MSLFITSLNSGSNGNCYYVGTAEDAVLIDAGLSCRETESRLKSCGLDISKVRAIFISHEHTDHIRGVEVLSRRHKLPVYITGKTLGNCRFWIQRELIRELPAQQAVSIGNISITAFPKFHDAADPHSFIAEAKGLTAGIFTDIGISCDELKKYFNRCDAAFLESNYDDYMLDNGPYPLHLKRRIKSEHGHLSNAQALELFLSHRSEKLRYLVLSHLSAENNHPDLVYELFSAHAGNIGVTVASRHEAMPVIDISAEPLPNSAPRKLPVQMRMEL